MTVPPAARTGRVGGGAADRAGERAGRDEPRGGRPGCGDGPADAEGLGYPLQRGRLGGPA